jgi:hypothetical protein
VGGPFRTSTLAALAVTALMAGGYARADERLRQHRQTFESLGATMSAIGDAWLATCRGRPPSTR